MLGDEDEVKERETKQEYNLLCDWVKQQLGDKVAKVQISKRLSSSPCVLVSGKFGWSANMERLVVDGVEYLHSFINRFFYTFNQNFSPLLQIDESSGSWRYFEFRVHEGEENTGN